MKNISIVLIALLTGFNLFLLCMLLSGCNAFIAHKDDLKPIAHDMADEGIDDFAEEIKPEKK